ncbi:FBP1-like protein [Mya arenaria]|uniref:FBP1-like protein n=1 Tax=Mya arenaria TaxID=6604 RepID=A0ABY7FAH6_MYAAR|nr:FBP1-like protein [Mya arenaria]
MLNEDINECTSNPCGLNGTCIDLLGAFNCSCALGWSGIACKTAVNGCDTAPCQNDAQCYTDKDLYYCTCNAGFSGAHCDIPLILIFCTLVFLLKGINNCSSNPCHNAATCIDTVNSYSCNCTTGYTGNNCEKNIDECASNPCQNGATCADAVNRYSCECAVGYTGDKCETNIDECSSNPCQNGATCVNAVNRYSCECAVGYTGDKCETISICLNSLYPSLSLWTHYALVLFTSDIDECSSNPCQNGATCVDAVNRYNCECAVGYTGDTCETSRLLLQFQFVSTRYILVCRYVHITLLVSLSDIDECSSNPCQNGATCVNAVNRYSCECAVGYTGDKCETNIDECSSNPCQNGAICVDAVNGYNCECAVGYTGDKCETNIDECSSNPCQNGATCADAVNRYSCECAVGYTGDKCETNIDECSSNPCQNGATCADAVNRYSCECAVGYTGDKCETNIDECSSNPCQNGATCVDAVNRYNCECAVGYTGDKCETNIDECSSNPCHNGATCADAVYRYNCECAVGYTGDKCATNIDECSSNPCQNGATCVDAVNGYNCECAVGYTGDKCETKNGDCSLDPCRNGATCVGAMNRYNCECAVGYTGNHCETIYTRRSLTIHYALVLFTSDIDECSSNPCQNGATCVDSVNRYSCECAVGYTGDKCETNIDECSSNPCQNGATFVDSVNRYNCDVEGIKLDITVNIPREDLRQVDFDDHATFVKWATDVKEEIKKKYSQSMNSHLKDILIHSLSKHNEEPAGGVQMVVVVSLGIGITVGLFILVGTITCCMIRARKQRSKKQRNEMFDAPMNPDRGAHNAVYSVNSIDAPDASNQMDE